jgi:hypothetical protein
VWLHTSPSSRHLPTLSGRCAYLTALGLLAILLGPDILRRLAIGADLAGLPAWATWPRTWHAAGICGAVLAAAAVWLLIVQARRAGRGHGRLVVPVAAASALGLLGLGLLIVAVVGRPTEPVSVVGVLAVTVAGLWLCLAVAGGHGISAAQLGLRPRWAADRTGRIQAVIIAALSLSFCGLGSALITGMLALPVPKMTSDQFDTLALSGLDAHAYILAAAFREEIVFVAAVAILLTAAGRPRWEIYAVSMTARILYHAYMGVPALGVALFAAVNVWLFLRTRRLTPLIAAHLYHNALGAYGQGIAPVLVLPLGLAALLLPRLQPADRSKEAT